MEKRSNGEPRTQEWQEWMLSRLVEPMFVRKNQNVKGPFTTADFVMWLLNEIFGPSNWSFRVLDGPRLITISNAMAYSQVTVRLTARFVDGQEVVHEEVGVWPVRATKSGGTLDKTAPEVYELGLKSAVTDGLKACTDHLGNCFRPITDLDLEGFLRRRQGEESLKKKGKSAAGESPQKSSDDLFGEDGANREPDDDGSVVEPASYPRSMTELYQMAENLPKPIAKGDAIQIMTASLDGKSIKDAMGEGWTTEDFWKLLIGDGSIAT